MFSSNLFVDTLLSNKISSYSLSSSETKFITNLVYVSPPEEIFNNKLNHFAHKADIVRLQKLIEHGGIYLDIDVWTNKSLFS